MSNVPPQPPVPPSSPGVPAGPLSPEQDKQFAAFSHFGGGAVAALALLFQLLVNIGAIGYIGFGIFSGTAWLLILAPAVPAVFYFVFKDRGAYTAQESREALNFQIIAAGAYLVVGLILTIIANSIAGNIAFGAGYSGIIVTLNIFGIVLLALLAFNIFFSLQAGLAVLKGGAYRYPILPVRLVK